MKQLWIGAAAAALCAACTTVAAEPAPATPVAEAPAPDLETEVSLVPEGWLAKSLPEIAEGLQTGQVRAVELVM